MKDIDIRIQKIPIKNIENHDRKIKKWKKIES